MKVTNKLLKYTLIVYEECTRKLNDPPYSEKC